MSRTRRSDSPTKAACVMVCRPVPKTTTWSAISSIVVGADDGDLSPARFNHRDNYHLGFWAWRPGKWIASVVLELD